MGSFIVIVVVLRLSNGLTSFRGVFKLLSIFDVTGCRYFNFMVRAECCKCGGRHESTECKVGAHTMNAVFRGCVQSCNAVSLGVYGWRLNGISSLNLRLGLLIFLSLGEIILFSPGRPHCMLTQKQGKERLLIAVDYLYMQSTDMSFILRLGHETFRVPKDMTNL